MSNKNKIFSAWACFYGVAILVTLIIGWSIGVGINKAERKECREWQRQAAEFTGFFLAGWQKEQCDHYGITIDLKKK